MEVFVFLFCELCGIDVLLFCFWFLSFFSLVVIDVEVVFLVEGLLKMDNLWFLFLRRDLMEKGDLNGFFIGSCVGN